MSTEWQEGDAPEFVTDPFGKVWKSPESTGPWNWKVYDRAWFEASGVAPNKEMAKACVDAIRRIANAHRSTA
jgi:hypothetical protein